jgi:hypothetical protein
MILLSIRYNFFLGSSIGRNKEVKRVPGQTIQIFYLKKMKNVIIYADGLAIGLAFCADGMSMLMVFLAMPTPA